MGFKKQIKRAAKASARTVKGAAKAAAKTAVRAAVNELKQQPLGRAARAVGKTLLTGHGDYTVNRTLGGRAVGAPSFGDTHFSIKRREALGSIVSSATPGAFNIQKFVINPGLAATFPWLSQLAAAFETWRPNGIVFEFLSLSGTAVGSTNTALGQVIMAPQYNAYAVDPSTKIQLEGYPDCVASCVDQSALCGIECKLSNRQSNALLVRNANVTSVASSMAAALFDLGDFFIATNGCQGSSITLGELWVTYDIEFWNPIVPVSYTPVFAQNPARYTIESVASTADLGAGAITSYDPNGYLVGLTNNTVTLRNMPFGSRWMIQSWVDINGANAALTCAYAVVAGCTVAGTIDAAGKGPEFTVSSSDHFCQSYLNVTAVDGVVQFNTNWTSAVAANKVFIAIIPIPTSYQPWP